MYLLNMGKGQNFFILFKISLIKIKVIFLIWLKINNKINFKINLNNKSQILSQMEVKMQ